MQAGKAVAARTMSRWTGEFRSRDRPHSFKHTCLLTDDLLATVEQLRSQGITIEREPKQGLDHNLQAWIRDPDGNAIELMQISDESPQRRTERASR